MGLAEVKANGVPVKGGAVTVGSDPVTLNLSLIEGVSTIAGEVHRGDAAASGVFVLLVPNVRRAPVVLNQSASAHDWQKQIANYTTLANGFLPATQKQIEGVMDLMEKNTRTSVELIKKDFLGRPR